MAKKKPKNPEIQFGDYVLLKKDAETYNVPIDGLGVVCNNMTAYLSVYFKNFGMRVVKKECVERIDR